MSFSVSNNLEMKVKSKSDTTGELKKVAIFENLNFGAGYNFLADSFNLSNINLSARTKLFNKRLDLNISSTLDPYMYQLDSIYINNRGVETVAQRRRSIYAWNAGEGIGQITNARLGLSINFKPKGAKTTSERIDELDDTGITEEEAFFVRCDRTTMTQADIDSGRLICQIGVAPVKPAEFVIFRIQLNTATK